MKNLKRQDRNGVRHVADIERKYKLGQIDYTAEEIEEMKKKIVVDSSLSASSSNAVANSVITQALNNKVNKEKGKELSSNDFTDELKEKLENAVDNAQENVIESISVNGVEQEIKEKNVDIKVQAISLLDVYPVGSIYMSVNSTNPSTLFGGTWEAWGAGRVPVGVDTTQTEFATVEQTGGEKAHELTISEIPRHRHGIYNYNANGSALTESSSILLGETATGWSGNGFTTYEGGGTAHNNLQPYITCYMWKRTA